MGGLSRRVTSELTGGRWLWRSGTAGRGGWVPWEVCRSLSWEPLSGTLKADSTVPLRVGVDGHVTRLLLSHSVRFYQWYLRCRWKW